MRTLLLAIALASLAGCVGVRANTALAPLTPAEETYVAQTASVIYRRASVERLRGVLFSDERGHGTCVRSPAGQTNAADYTLLVLQRRITEDFISQVDDDVLILRSAVDAAPCRRLAGESALWVRAN